MFEWKQYEVSSLKKFVVVDLETTGNSPKKGDRIIQFAAVSIVGGKITNTYSTYIDPEIPIPSFITELTGITDEDVAQAPIFYEVAEEIFRLLDGHIFVAHNAHFDWNFLQEEFHMNGFPNARCRLIDTVEMTRILMPTMESYRLTDIAEYAGLEHDRPHQADSDALVTARWFLTLLDKAASLPYQTLQQLQRLAKGLKTDLSLVFRELILQKTAEDDDLAEEWTKYKNLVIRKFPDQDENETLEDGKRSPVFVMDQFINGGSYENDLAEMVEHVYSILNQNEFSLIEVDPLLDKTAGYLIPAMMFSKQKQKTVVISTHTTARQEALVEKEIPEIERRLELPVKACLLKGKGHYLDLQKFNAILMEEEEHYDETLAKMQILVWLLETTTGDKSELNLSSGGELFWKRINALSARRSEKLQDRIDFYERALLKARNAHIIVTNHHFLMYHLTSDENVLPDFDHLIIDEAHQFERDVARYFGHSLGFQQIKFLLGRIGTRGQPRLLQQLVTMNKRHQLPFPITSEELEKGVQEFSDKIDEFFQLAYSFMQRTGKNNLLCNFTTIPELGYGWERLYAAFQHLFRALETIHWHIEEIFPSLSVKERMLTDDLALIVEELRKIEQLHEDLMDKQSSRIVWIESNGQSLASARLFSEPVFIGNDLKDIVYYRLKSVVFVSNTLTIDRSFTFVRNELGLDEFPVVTKQFFSRSEPEKAKVYNMVDVPDIKGVTEEDFIQEIAKYITTIAEAVKGRLLVLFPSREMVQKTFQEIRKSPALDDYVLLAQGVTAGSPRRLLKQFTRFQKVMLFGANVFWDGLDFTDAHLDALIVVRLPFMPPDHPVHRGKTARLKRMGKNPFYNYSLPVAVLRFKQGFNHLLTGDPKKRLFIILDPRVHTKAYGRYFLDSIPLREVGNLTLPELYFSLKKEKN